MKDKIKLLILEDSIDDAGLIEATLSQPQHHYEVKVVYNQNDFIEALDYFMPEAILISHTLPQFAFGPALQIGKDKLPYVPFVYVTGSWSGQFAASIITERADDYVSKNNLKHLPEAIEKAIEKKQTEKEQAFLISIVNSSNDAIISVTRDEIISGWNAGAEKIYGYPGTEVIGKNISLLIPDDRLHEEPELMAKVYKGEFTGHYETQRKTKNGCLIPIAQTISPIKDARGNIIGTSRIARDITERITAEKKREYDQNNLGSLVNNTEDLMWSVDRDLKLVTCNKAFDKKIELTSGKSLVKGSNILSDQFDEARLKRYKSFYARALAGETFTVADYFDFPVNFWSEISFYPILQSDAVIGVACFSRDITERKKAEEDLKYSEMRLNEAQAITHISNWEIDLLQNVHSWSDEFYRIYRLDRKEVQPSVGLFLSFMHPEDADFAQKKILGALNSFKESSFEFRFIRKDGKERYGYAQWKFEFDKTGKPLRLFGVLQDTTEHKETEKALISMEQKILRQKIQEQKRVTRAIIRAQEKERNHLGQELHDNINQMLAGSKIYLNMAGKRNAQVKEVVKYPVDLIDISIKEIRSLCQKMVTPVENINLEELVGDLIITLKQNKTIKTDFFYDISNELITDDLKLNIYRIIQEQTSNILKYADAKNIEISIKSLGKAVNIIITDNGKGFDLSSKRKGIGISNIINRIKSYNGELKIKSSPGNGCKIHVSIPIEYIKKDTRHLLQKDPVL